MTARRAALPADVQAVIDACEGKAPPPQATCDAAAGAFYAAFNRREPLPAMRKAYEAAQNLKLNEKLYVAMNCAGEFTQTGTLKEYDGESLLARLDGARTLFVIGQYDETRISTVAAFAEQVPGGAEFAVIPGAAHGIFNDRPDESVAVVRGFLRRQDALAQKDTPAVQGTKP